MGQRSRSKGRRGREREVEGGEMGEGRTKGREVRRERRTESQEEEKERREEKGRGRRSGGGERKTRVYLN